MKLRVTLQREKNKQAITLGGSSEVVILDKLISSVSPRQSIALALQFQLEYEDSYILQIELNY